MSAELDARYKAGETLTKAEENEYVAWMCGQALDLMRGGAGACPDCEGAGCATCADSGWSEQMRSSGTLL